jgi:hypothetical protein
MIKIEHRVWGLWLLAGALLVIFYRLLLGETFFWGLPAMQFYPWRDYAFDLIRAGQIPLWNSYNGAGAPLLANYQSALLYPFNWPGLFLPLAWWMSVTSVLHLFIGGAGVWLLGKRMGMSPLGQNISALSFGLTGYLVARAFSYPTVTAAVWLPLMLWAAQGILTNGRRRDTAWLATFTGLQLLAGHAQSTWYSLLLTAAFCGWWAITHRPLNKQRLALVIVALALGGGIAAAQLIPTAELLNQSQRSGGVDFEFAMNFSYDLPRTLNLLAPNVFGTPADGSYLAKGAFFEDAVYIGFIPLISALTALLTWAWGKLRRKQRPPIFATVPFWLLTLVIAYVLALGDNSPIFPFLYRTIPTFSLFQAPVRWHLWSVLALSVLAGIGVSVWGRGYWLLFGTRLAIAASLGAVVLATVGSRFLPPEVAQTAGFSVITRSVISLGILGALAGLLTLRQPENTGSRWYAGWMLAVLLVVSGDLVAAASGLNPTVSADFYTRRTPPTLVQRPYWPEKIEKAVSFEQYLPFEDYPAAQRQAEAFRSSGLANMNLIDRYAVLNNFDPLQVGGMVDYLQLLEAHPEQQATLLRAAGSGGVYGEDGVVKPLPQPSPRAWWVSSACWLADSATLETAMLNPTWNPEQQVLLRGSGDCPPPPEVASVPAVVQDQPNATQVELNAPADGWLVLADTFYPGWVARIGDQTVPIERANGAFRAVAVTAGAQTIHFDYRPQWPLPGIVISILSVLVLLVLFRSRNPDNI